jgi:hypothetical protein
MSSLTVAKCAMSPRAGRPRVPIRADDWLCANVESEINHETNGGSIARAVEIHQ